MQEKGVMSHTDVLVNVSEALKNKLYLLFTKLV